MLSNFLTILVVREKIKVRPALAILAGFSKILADEMIQTTLLVTLKTIKILSMQSKAVTCFQFLLFHLLEILSVLTSLFC